jgi:hypothetical protein
MKRLFHLDSGEELIKKTKPHSASFLSSPMFLIGALILIVGLPRGLIVNSLLIRILFIGTSLLLIAVSYLRRVRAYTFYFTNRRVVSSYSFLRKAYREISFNNLTEVRVLQDIFGKACGYADVWFYGYQNGWVIGRMRGVTLGDSYIATNKAWNKQN